MTAYVYALHEVDEEYRYIGMTTRSPYQRLKEHVRHANRGNKTAVHCWIRKHGGSVQITIIDVCETKEQAQAMEKYWIASARNSGLEILNHTDGGEGTFGWSPTSETRNKMSQSHMGCQNAAGSVRSDEHKAAVSRAHIGETRARMSNAAMGNTKAKALKGKPKTEAHKNKLKGPKSEEHKLALSISSHIRWHTQRGIVKIGCVHCEAI